MSHEILIRCLRQCLIRLESPEKKIIFTVAFILTFVFKCIFMLRLIFVFIIVFIFIFILRLIDMYTFVYYVSLKYHLCITFVFEGYLCLPQKLGK